MIPRCLSRSFDHLQRSNSVTSIVRISFTRTKWLQKSDNFHFVVKSDQVSDSLGAPHREVCRAHPPRSGHHHSALGQWVTRNRNDDNPHFTRNTWIYFKTKGLRSSHYYIIQTPWLEHCIFVKCVLFANLHSRGNAKKNSIKCGLIHLQLNLEDSL